MRSTLQKGRRSWAAVAAWSLPAYSTACRPTGYQRQEALALLLGGEMKYGGRVAGIGVSAGKEGDMGRSGQIGGGGKRGGLDVV